MASTEAAAPAPTVPTKPVDTIVLDSAPLLLNSPPLSTLLSQCNTLVATPNVISEIRDEEARQRVETTYLPFLVLRSPKPASVKFVKEFARRTGDGAVLSAVDIEVIALAYELEIEKNGGDWRLRNAPGQKTVNGKPPVKQTEETPAEEKPAEENLVDGAPTTTEELVKTQEDAQKEEVSAEGLAQAVESVQINDEVDAPNAAPEDETQQDTSIDTTDIVEVVEESGDDSDGWITPSNIKKHQAKDKSGGESSKTENKVLQVATITGDFAMQNVLLQINLNLLSPNTCKRIQTVRTTVLRCHGCFATTKEMNKQFCPRCGQPTLTRVTCTTNDRGEVKLHLKKNMQWNNKGNVFSIPKPTGGHSNQKWVGPRDGGGQSGWGNGLILAEDQKEYVRAMSTQRRTKNRDLMDQDSLPSILTGERQTGGGKLKVGGGRSINSRKR